MKRAAGNNGSVFLIVVFAIALIATITVGIMVMTTEELQLIQNQLYAAQAIATAEAGLNDTFAQIRSASGSSGTSTFTLNSSKDARMLTIAISPKDNACCGGEIRP